MRKSEKIEREISDLKERKEILEKQLARVKALDKARVRKKRSHQMYVFAGDIAKLYKQCFNKYLFNSDSAADEAALSEILSVLKKYFEYKKRSQV